MSEPPWKRNSKEITVRPSRNDSAPHFNDCLSPSILYIWGTGCLPNQALQWPTADKHHNVRIVDISEAIFRTAQAIPLIWLKCVQSVRIYQLAYTMCTQETLTTGLPAGLRRDFLNPSLKRKSQTLNSPLDGRIRVSGTPVSLYGRRPKIPDIWEEWHTE